MRNALIGHSGFVGQNLAAQAPFDAFFRSRDIESIRGESYDLVVAAALPAAKWIANRSPEDDLANATRLLENLSQVRARMFVLVSTVDVYPTPVGVDESTPIPDEAGHPYGRHRRMVEVEIERLFPKRLIVRLPGLFGRGLKKNAVYDLLHDHQVDRIHADAVFQFYGLEHLWRDVQTALENGLRLVNLATEPVSMEDVARVAFGIGFQNRPEGIQPARYEVRTNHAGVFGGRDGYIQGRAQVLGEMRDFVRQERSRSGE